MKFYFHSMVIWIILAVVLAWMATGEEGWEMFRYSVFSVFSAVNAWQNWQERVPQGPSQGPGDQSGRANGKQYGPSQENLGNEVTT